MPFPDFNGFTAVTKIGVDGHVPSKACAERVSHANHRFGSMLRRLAPIDFPLVERIADRSGPVWTQ
jgi:hypothetical protein